MKAQADEFDIFSTMSDLAGKVEEGQRFDILEMYRTALTIRLFEEKVDWLFARGKLGGTTHLCIGQEAVAVGVMQALRADDYIVSTHRGHGHLIARGAEIKKIFSELLGKREGYCKGRGGTQHLSVMELNFLGTNGITGGGLPIATGAGLSIKLSGEDRVAVCFFGEGASNQGTFHESLNMASAWDLPVVYVCENNMYAMSTRFTKVSRSDDVATRAAAFGIPSVIVDGMDAVKVAENAKTMVHKVREGTGPVLIEAKTYRFCGHSKSDARVYRSREQESEWKDKDPLIKMEATLLERISHGELEHVRRSVKSMIEDSYAEAERGADPDLKDATEGVYAEREDIIS
jgi:TPP-dependent pyruvate/acetoin dehydrogenase alpha subunit